MARWTRRRRYALLLAAFGTTSATILIAAAPASAIFGCGLNPFCLGGKAIGGAISSVAGDAITALAKAVLGALGHAVEWASTLWVGIGTPPVADGAGQPTGTVAFLQQNLLVFTTGLAVLCTLIGAGRIVYHEHKAAQLRELGRYLVTYVLVSGAAAGAASVLIGGSDQMASWFINQASAHSNFADHLANLLGLATAGTTPCGGGSGGVHGRACGDGHDGVYRDRAGDHRVPRDGDPDHADAGPRRDAGAVGGDAAVGRGVLEHRDGPAVVPQSRRVAGRVRAVQAGGGDRVRGRVRSRRPAGRAGAAGRRDDARARDPRAAGAAAVRGARHQRARRRRRSRRDARGRGGRRDRDADADRSRFGRIDARERVRARPVRRPVGCRARRRRARRGGGDERRRRPVRRVRPERAVGRVGQHRHGRASQLSTGQWRWRCGRRRLGWRRRGERRCGICRRSERFWRRRGGCGCSGVRGREERGERRGGVRATPAAMGRPARPGTRARGRERDGGGSSGGAHVRELAAAAAAGPVASGADLERAFDRGADRRDRRDRARSA